MEQHRAVLRWRGILLTFLAWMGHSTPTEPDCVSLQQLWPMHAHNQTWCWRRQCSPHAYAQARGKRLVVAARSEGESCAAMDLTWGLVDRDNRCLAFNATRLFDRFGGRHIALVGDSQVRDLFLSFVSMLAAVTRVMVVMYKPSVRGLVQVPSAGISVEMIYAPFLCDMTLVASTAAGCRGNYSGTHCLTVYPQRWNPFLEAVLRPGGRHRGAGTVLVVYVRAWFSQRPELRSQMVPRLLDDLKAAVQRGLSVHTVLIPQLEDHFDAPWDRGGLCRHDGPRWDWPTNKEHVGRTQALLQLAEGRARAMPVTVFDAWALARARADAHPGAGFVSHRKGGRLHGTANVSADCAHWCTPGVPDLWNAALFTAEPNLLMGLGSNVQPERS